MTRDYFARRRQLSARQTLRFRETLPLTSDFPRSGAGFSSGDVVDFASRNA